MKSLGLFSQIAVVGLSFVIGYFYVQPTVAEIGDTQTEIARYDEERKKIEAINDQLAMHLATLDSIPPSDRERLARYMPRVADDISIMRDISFIAERASMTMTTLSYNGPLDERNSLFSQNGSSDSSSSNQTATPYAFSVGVQGSYEEIKDFLRLLELNEYPLEIHQLSLNTNTETTTSGVVDNEAMSATMTLVTYVDELVLVNGN